MSKTSTFKPATGISQSLASNSGRASDSHGPSPPSSSGIFPLPAQNPALNILRARDRIAAEADEEFSYARRGEDAQRRFLDMGTIRRVLAMRDQQRLSDDEIERQVGLKKGVVASLSAISEAHVKPPSAEDSGLYG